jgi:Cdc6-like AAA superfamily ATPase
METEPVQLSQNLWDRWGFSGDPFDTNPLPINYGAGLSVITAYIARGGILDPGSVMRNFMKNPGGGRIVVEGEPGVGKTTFVNYHRYEWEFQAKPPLLSPVSHISVQKNWEEEDFLLHLLSSLSARVRLEMKEAEAAKDPLLKEVSAITGVQQEEDGEFGLSLSFAGTGGSINKPRKLAVKVGKLTSIDLRQYLTRLVTKVREQLGYGGVIFHLDNLELLKQKNETKLRDFFEDIRDAIQEPHVYFVFVGYKGMYQEVIVPAPRVRSIFFDKPLNIEPLSVEQVREIIARRYELLAGPRKRWIKPVEDAVIDYYYETFEGKIRYVMNAVTSLVSHLPDSYADTLTMDRAGELLRAIQMSEISARLSKIEIEVFLEAVRLRRFTPTALGKATGKSKQSIQKYLKKLLECRYVYHGDKVGRSQYYDVEPRFQILMDH